MRSTNSEAPSGQVVLFDFDGTLVDSAGVIVAALRRALGRAGVEHRHLDATVLGAHVGVPLPDLLPALGVPASAVVPAIAAFQAYFAAHGAAGTVPYPGVEAMLDTLAAGTTTLGLATAKPASTAAAVIEHLGWARRFGAVAGAHDDETGGAKHEVIARALELLEARAGGPIDPSQVVMVGDRASDVIGARRCGIEAFAVSWGYGSADELAGAKPLAVIDSVAELAAALRSRGAAVRERPATFR